ncbi:MAG: histidine--tRNA ligase [Acidobacteria bacterium]|nr:histidine--tRNA ligase [Acidobacteriota bacterium]
MPDQRSATSRPSCNEVPPSIARDDQSAITPGPGPSPSTCPFFGIPSPVSGPPIPKTGWGNGFGGGGGRHYPRRVAGEVFKAPTGTHDVVPPTSARWEALERVFADLATRAGFGLLRTPVFEDLAVFKRVGEATDVVRKEMYDFEDKGGRHLALRPEGTAPVVRSFVQHRPPLPWKVWYQAPMFRYERPQAGRYRQHHQVGVEVLCTDDADLDVEVIALGHDYLRQLGLHQVTLLVNSLGDATCKPAYLDALRAHFATRTLCDEHKERYVENPLRVLDCKREACVGASADAPRMVDNLCEPCGAHFARVTAGLTAAGIDHTVESRLVRGLDYYTRTTFEFQADALDAAQSGVLGGGRYDGLVESMGGPPTPGIGFGSGIERVLLACDAEGVFPGPEASIDVFVVDVTGGETARDLVLELRRAGLGAERAYDGRSMKSQMKQADRSGARLALIVGDDELAAGEVTVRPLSGGDQDRVPRTDVIDRVRKLL